MNLNDKVLCEQSIFSTWRINWAEVFRTHVYSAHTTLYNQVKPKLVIRSLKSKKFVILLHRAITMEAIIQTMIEPIYVELTSQRQRHHIGFCPWRPFGLTLMSCSPLTSSSYLDDPADFRRADVTKAMTSHRLLPRASFGFGLDVDGVFPVDVLQLLGVEDGHEVFLADLPGFQRDGGHEGSFWLHVTGQQQIKGQMMMMISFV